MNNRHIIPICLAFIATPFSVFASSVVINEVMFDPLGSDSGYEWVELYNTGDEQADISGWEVYPDGIGYFTIPHGFLLGAKKFVVIHLKGSGSHSITDLYHTTTSSSNMGNTSGSVAIFRAGMETKKDRIKDFMQWGRSDRKSTRLNSSHRL